ncbi:MAG: alpha/beta hydrolase family protein [Deltaproteobacteria bacterium]|nr:alpha/beta hydrolase family protein [Deltaproteobacteria bacterium]
MAHDHVALASRLLGGAGPPSADSAAARVGSRLGAVVDDVALRVIAGIFLASHRRGVDDGGHGPLVSAWQAHADAAARDPQPFFPRPGVPGVTRVRGGSLDGGWVEDLSFGSDYAPERDTARAVLDQYPDNAVARARHYRHAAAGHAAVVCLHTWAGGRHVIDAAVFRAKWLFALGLDVYLYVQPYHGARRPRRTLLRGTLHPSTNVTRTNEAFLQTAWEVRALLAWHQAEAGRGGGVMGASLGGYGAAMLASVAPEIEFVIAMLPVADMAALMWAHGAGTEARERALARGMTFERFCRLMAVHSPLARPRPALPKERLLVVAGRGDRIVPPVHAEVLWEHWDRPAIHWFPGGHLTHFGRGGYLDAVRTHLERLGVVAAAADRGV